MRNSLAQVCQSVKNTNFNCGVHVLDMVSGNEYLKKESMDRINMLTHTDQRGTICTSKPSQSQPSNNERTFPGFLLCHRNATNVHVKFCIRMMMTIL